MKAEEGEELQVKLQEVIKKISEEEKRVTPQRVLLTKLILARVKDHASLKDLFQEAQEQLPRVGISTVYNTIKMLESMGVIDTFTVDDKLRIDQPTPHINVYCKNTGKVFDVDGQVMEALSTMLRERGIQVKKAIVEANCP
ncbi:MAG: transcriptional repressor [Acidilobus sp.]|nr:transcriptional repressor [Acidilobus sp.]MCG2890059.1 transcriptional repressor [Acidilobus sp.]MCG2890977.1 transcriptional repressor [Acidilobus sp.]